MLRVVGLILLAALILLWIQVPSFNDSGSGAGVIFIALLAILAGYFWPTYKGPAKEEEDEAFAALMRRRHPNE